MTTRSRKRDARRAGPPGTRPARQNASIRKTRPTIGARETFWWALMVVAGAAVVFTPHGLWILFFAACCVLCFSVATSLEMQRRGRR